jgi:hypothetical protein
MLLGGREVHGRFGKGGREKVEKQRKFIRNTEEKLIIKRKGNWKEKKIWKKWVKL